MPGSKLTRRQKITAAVVGLAIGIPIFITTGVISNNNGINVANGTTTTTAAATTTTTAGGTTTTVSGGGTFGPTSPTPICGTSVLNSPYNATAPTVTQVQSLLPSGFPTLTSVVTEAAGDNSGSVGQNFNIHANTVYYFAPGVHTIGGGAFAQIQPKSGDVFIGGYNGTQHAIIDGQLVNEYAFVTTGEANVAILYLTVEDFNSDNATIAQASGDATNYFISWDTVQFNQHAGVGLQGGTTLQYSCVRNNGQEGFKSSSGNAGNNLLDHDEISFNNTCNQDDFTPDPVPAGTIPNGVDAATAGGRGASCAANCATGGPCPGEDGAGKFWDSTNVVVTNSYIHDNYGQGLWWDTNDNGAYVFNNYISNNFKEGIQFETSYNLWVKQNTFIGNGWCGGQGDCAHEVGGFGMPAIYLSESGGDSRATPVNHAAPGNVQISTMLIDHNTFTDNWDGIILYENADRYCTSSANTSTGYCTLVRPDLWSGFSAPSQCTYTNSSSLINTAPYNADCRWRTQNTTVSNNHFNFNAANLGSQCTGVTAAVPCGSNNLFSNGGSFCPYTSPSSCGGVGLGGGYVETNITQNQNNHFTNNVYTHTGSVNWSFLYYDQSGAKTPSQWQACPASNTVPCQDAGSTFS